MRGRMSTAGFVVVALLIAVTNASSAQVRAPPSAISGTHPRAQQIRSLPGYAGELKPGHFSGEITVDEARQRKLWYWLVPSESEPATDPIVLWLTGGPGCSSLDAFIYENGPFRLTFTDDGDARSAGAPSWRNIAVSDNPHRWSKVATMVFIDSPAGTGMSTSRFKEDYTTNDTRTIADLNTFVEQLLDVFPEYADNELYIAGESYAGVYVPLLARSLLKARVGGDGALVNIKGYLIGNGVTDDAYDSNHGVEFAYGHALISQQQLQRLESACQGNYWNASRASECKHLQWAMEDGFGDLNIYAIYHPCTLHGGRVAGSAAAQDGGLRMSQLRAQLGGRRWPLAGGIGQGEEVLNWGHLLKHVIPCADRRQALAWFNSPEVRRAIHGPSMHRLPQWTPCSDVLRYTHDTGSMLPVHRHNLRHGLRVLVYSGDADYVVPFTGTRAWLHDLGLPESLSWRPWTHHQQVAGFYSRYRGGLTFATVKGAGHMVPQTHPELALELFRWFLSDGVGAGSSLGQESE